MSEPLDELVLQLTVFGQHVDGAPKTFAHLRLDVERVEALLGLLPGGRQHPGAEPASAVASDDGAVFPEFVRRRDTQRRPFYTVFQDARSLFEARFMRPELVAHLETVDFEEPEYMLSPNEVGFLAHQKPVRREMIVQGVPRRDLHRARVALTAPDQRTALLRRIADRHPEDALHIVSDETPLFGPDGRVPMRDALGLADALDPETVATILATADAEAREHAVRTVRDLLGPDAARFLPAARRAGR